MKLRSGKRYKVEECWWYKYTLEACGGKKRLEEEDKDLFMLGQYTFKEWLQIILPLYENSETIKRYG